MWLGVESILIPTNTKLMMDEKYLNLIPRPTDQERKSLKFSIIDEGQLMPIIANQNNIILDGHTRAEICEELHLKPKYMIKKFKSESDERKFVIMANLARRQLTTFQKIELAWEIYEVEKVKAREREFGHGGVGLKGVKLNTQSIGTAAQIFGKYMEVGKNTIQYIAYLKENADPTILEKLRTGELSINRAFALVKGLKLISGRPKKPKVKPKECPLCNNEIHDKSTCHVHKWYCCNNCKWGL